MKYFATFQLQNFNHRLNLNKNFVENLIAQHIVKLNELQSSHVIELRRFVNLTISSKKKRNFKHFNSNTFDDSNRDEFRFLSLIAKLNSSVTKIISRKIRKRKLFKT